MKFSHVAVIYGDEKSEEYAVLAEDGQQAREVLAAGAVHFRLRGRMRVNSDSSGRLGQSDNLLSSSRTLAISF